MPEIPSYVVGMPRLFPFEVEGPEVVRLAAPPLPPSCAAARVAAAVLAAARRLACSFAFSFSAFASSAKILCSSAAALALAPAFDLFGRPVPCARETKRDTESRDRR